MVRGTEGEIRLSVIITPCVPDEECNVIKVEAE